MVASAGPRDVHDRLVKRVFARKAAFAVELRRVLPPELVTRVDLRTLARCWTERTDERLRGRLADLCFTGRFLGEEQRLPVYFPLEHCSTVASLLPLRAIACATALWHEHLADHPETKVLPLVVPIVFTQPRARNTPIQLSTILDVPPDLHARVPGPIEVRAYADDLSGSVLHDPHADPVTLALVELTRALLHAYRNPGALTAARMAELAPLFDVLLSQREPLATNDVRALLTYVLRSFDEGSPVRALVEDALRGRPRQMFVSIADSLVAKGRVEGRAEGLARGVLGVLEHRFSSVPEKVRRRVWASRDEHRLHQWFERALTVASLDDVFDEREE